MTKTYRVVDKVARFESPKYAPMARCGYEHNLMGMCDKPAISYQPSIISSNGPVKKKYFYYCERHAPKQVGSRGGKWHGMDTDDYYFQDEL